MRTLFIILKPVLSVIVTSARNQKIISIITVGKQRTSSVLISSDIKAILIIIIVFAVLYLCMGIHCMMSVFSIASGQNIMFWVRIMLLARCTTFCDKDCQLFAVGR